MKRIIYPLLLLFLLSSCNEKQNIKQPENKEANTEYILAVDISSYPEIAKTKPVFYDASGKSDDFLNILKRNGVNTIRLRLWANPKREHSGYEEVKDFSAILKSKGFKIWLTVHYSDTWADPAQQIIPSQWRGMSFSQLKIAVENYTKQIVTEIMPDYLQIGNEINTGFLHPWGHFQNNFDTFKNLMNTAISTVRKNSKKTKIILHFAGIEGTNWFFSKIAMFDYDMIGLSYYPIWHKKSLVNLKNTMQELSDTYKKDIVIAETAYPFTLKWNDWTDNVVGLENQLILPEYPATPEGQQKFVKAIKTIVRDMDKGRGFCYWGAELIAWKGEKAKDASAWENQALFDFDNKALPALGEFNLSD